MNPSLREANQDTDSGQMILVSEAPLAFLGEMLIAARKARGWSQRRFASESGINQVVIARWEVDKYRGIGLERAVQVARILGLSVSITATIQGSQEPMIAED